MISKTLQLFSVVFLGLTLWSSSAAALNVNELRFGAHDGKTRMVIDISARTDFRAFVLTNPNRLIVDLPEFQWQAGAVDAAKKAGISAVRQGNLEQGVSRIVFDLKQPIVLDKAFTLPRQDGKSDRLVIDYKPVEAGSLQTAQNKPLGTLVVGGTKPLKVPHGEAPYQTASLGAITPPPSTKSKKKQKPLIVLDPGHGGIDPGAIGANKVKEKTIVLNLSKELKRQLESTGKYRVILTREDDRYIRLRDRVAFARKHDADLFVSVHADSIRKSHVRGASVYTLSEKASDAQTAKLAERENRSDIIAGVDLTHEDEEVLNILVDLAMRDTMNQSKFFANTIVDTFENHGIKILENPHRYVGFAVLKAPDIPSILLEAGFISNRTEAKALNTSKHRARIAKAMVAGISAYFKKMEDNEKT